MHLTPAGGCWRHHCWLTSLLTSCLHTGIRAGRMAGDSDPNGPAAGIIPAICIIVLPLSNIQPAVNVFLFPFCQSAVDYASHLHHSDCHCPGRHLLPAASSFQDAILWSASENTAEGQSSNNHQAKAIQSLANTLNSIANTIHSIATTFHSLANTFKMAKFPFSGRVAAHSSGVSRKKHPVHPQSTPIHPSSRQLQISFSMQGQKNRSFSNCTHRFGLCQGP